MAGGNTDRFAASLADFCRAFFAARNRKGRILAIIKKNRHNPDKLLSGLL